VFYAVFHFGEKRIELGKIANSAVCFFSASAEVNIFKTLNASTPYDQSIFAPPYDQNLYPRGHEIYNFRRGTPGIHLTL
jgi:hypothetical protein